MRPVFHAWARGAGLHPLPALAPLCRVQTEASMQCTNPTKMHRGCTKSAKQAPPARRRFIGGLRRLAPEEVVEWWQHCPPQRIWPEPAGGRAAAEAGEGGEQQAQQAQQAQQQLGERAGEGVCGHTWGGYVGCRVHEEGCQSVANQAFAVHLAAWGDLACSPALQSLIPCTLTCRSAAPAAACRGASGCDGYSNGAGGGGSPSVGATAGTARSGGACPAGAGSTGCGASSRLRTASAAAAASA